MLRGVMLGVALLAVVSPVYAQLGRNTSLQNQTVIYKWEVDGVAHYSKIQPRGVKDYKMINEYGLEISADRPYITDKDSNIMHRAQRIAASMPQEDESDANTPPEGSITRAERCEAARNNLRMLQTKPTVYEEDGNGNLVPLNELQRASRIEEMNRSISELCD